MASNTTTAPEQKVPTPEPATAVDVSKQTEVRKSLLKRRTGMRESWLTRTQLGSGLDSKGL